MYHNYLAPVILLFVSIIVFRILFKKFAGRRVEGFQEEKSIPAPNDRGVKLLYEIRGMMLNDQNDIDKQIQLLSEKRDTSIVLDKMSELENLLKGKTTMEIDPTDEKEAEENKDQSSEEEQEEPREEGPAEKPAKKTKKKVNMESKPKKVEQQPVDESSDEEDDIVEGFVQGVEYNSSATNCFEI
jgi:outer membrane biosynthesis protein TonB